MGKKILFAYLLILLCSNLRAATPDTFHNILYYAYAAENTNDADSLFELSNKWVIDDSTEAYQNFFKYYYHYKNRNKDSSSYYNLLAAKQLLKTNQLESYYKVVNNRLWDMIDESKYDEAIEFSRYLIKKAEELNDTGMYIKFNAHAAVVYHDIEQFEKGIRTAKAGLKYQEIERYKASTAQCYNAIGICFDDWNKPDSAIYYHRKNLKLLKNESDFITQTYNNLGNTYFKTENWDSAYKYIDLATSINKISGNEYNLATSLNNLGNILMNQNKYQEAKLVLDSALYYSIKSGNNEKLRDVHHTLYTYYQDRGLYKEALNNLELHHKFKDTMLNNERIEIINNLEFRAKEAEYSEEIANTKAESTAKNLWLVLICGILIITLLLARQFYLKRKQAQEEAKMRLQNERLRISRDLHDNLGAELTYISSIVDQKAFNIKDPEKKAEMEQISSSSRHAMDQMRETIWAIKTNEISVRKFAQKVNQTSKKYAESANTLLKINTSGDNVLLPPSVVIVLLRICQESINNAVKYANSEKITIDINVENDLYNIEIKDNGVGFDLQNSKRGYGLNNMKERMLEIQGHFDIYSELGKGTQITLSGQLKEKYD